jgi:hypothetical protein
MALSPVHQCFSLLELVNAIGSHFSNPADLSRLALCNRLFHEAFTSLLYRDIRISMRAVRSMIFTFRKVPRFALLCRSFALDQSTPFYEDEIVYDDLVILFEILTKEDNLTSFSWTSRRPNESFSVVPPKLWKVLPVVSELSITIRDFKHNEACRVRVFLSY